MVNTRQMESGYTLDGVVDSAGYPGDKSYSENLEYPFWVEENVKDFQANRAKYQQGYNEAITRIVEGCRKN